MNLRGLFFLWVVRVWFGSVFAKFIFTSVYKVNFSSVSTWLYSVIYSVNAEVVLKATNVDGVFDEDPKRNPQARLHETLTYQEVTSKDLSVMDMTAITLCQENNIPGKSRWQTFIWTFFFIYIYFLIIISLNFSLPCQKWSDFKLPLPFLYGAVVVFNLNKPGNIEKAIKGERVGTLIGATWNSTVSRTWKYL